MPGAKHGPFIREQKYGKLRKTAKKAKTLFVDHAFPANGKSIAHSRSCHGVEWKRPWDICKSPNFEMIKSLPLADDIRCGPCGNNWFVSACCTLSRNAKYWKRVTNGETNKSTMTKYYGIFHFKLWQFDSWVDVVIDDLLPTLNGALLFCYSKTNNNFWCPLLEKAYAKLLGDYECLKYCTTIDTLVDFTGGIPQKCLLKEPVLKDEEKRMKMYSKLRAALENEALITCPIVCPYAQIGKPASQGLLKGFTYELREIKKAKMTRTAREKLELEELYLCRMTNPDPSVEWKGDWAEKSDIYLSLLEADRNYLGLHYEETGDFWMSFEDFLRHFHVIHFCHFFLTGTFAKKIPWKEHHIAGEWKTATKGSISDRAGGGKGTTSYLKNPQYCFTIKKKDEDPFAICLEQRNTCLDSRLGGVIYESIGLHLLKVEENRVYRVHVCDDQCEDMSRYEVGRNVFFKTKLNRGRYVILPTTCKPGLEGEFVVRVFTSKGIKLKVMETEFPRRKRRWWASNPVIVTSIHVIRVLGIDFREKGKAYLRASCEGKKVKSPEMMCGKISMPIFNFKSIFYRHYPLTTPIAIEVWYLGDLLGTAKIAHPHRGSGYAHTYRLYDKGDKEERSPVAGQIEAIVKTSTDMTEL